MMGRSHALAGALAWLGGAPAGFAAAHVPLPIATLAAGAVVCVGAALLPDLDHPASGAARTLGPVSAALADAVSVAAGGHRHRTHSLAFAAAAGAGTWALVAAKPGWAEVVVFAVTAFAVHLLGPHSVRTSALAGLVAAGAVTLAVHRWAPPGPWLAVAVAAGCVTHLAGDALTPGGVPVLWPAHWRLAVPLLDTNGGLERLVALGLALALAWRAWTLFEPPVHRWALAALSAAWHIPTKGHP